MERLSLFQIALKRLGMPISKYLINFVLPATIGGLAVSLILYTMLSSLFVGASNRSAGDVSTTNHWSRHHMASGPNSA